MYISSDTCNKAAINKKLYFSIVLILLLSVISFQQGRLIQTCNSQTTTSVYTSYPETFESGSKTAYAYGTVTLPTGLWALDDALIGTSASDRKAGSKSVRIQNSGKLTLLSDLDSGISKICILHASFGSDTASSWGLWVSSNGGITWHQAAANITTTGTELVQSVFTISYFGNTRIEIRKSGGGRLNIDNISITNNAGTCCCGGCTTSTDTIPTQDDHLTLGNPSSATTGSTDSNNYLMIKHQYALSYNNSKGRANWVCWHLSMAWKGTADRCDCFTQDGTLPSGFFRASTSHYTSTGFDRGHLCPSDDRDLSDSDNAATFKMTNIIPQAPDLNQVTWLALENYCRNLITHGNELYIISGGYGSGGSGSLGGTTYTIGPSGRIHVPAHYWKIIVVLPVGSSDLSRVSTGTRVIAVDMPNVQTVTAHTWDYYRTTTDAIEAITGFNFLSNVSTTIQSAIESTVDSGPTY